MAILVIKDAPMPGVCELCMQTQEMPYIETHNARVCFSCVCDLIEVFFKKEICRTCYTLLDTTVALREHKSTYGHSADTNFPAITSAFIKKSKTKSYVVDEEPVPNTEASLTEADTVFNEFMSKISEKKG